MDNDINRLISHCIDHNSKESWQEFVSITTPFIHHAIHATCQKYNIYVNRYTEDITQEVFLKIMNNDRKLLKQFNPSRASWSTWIQKITVNTTIDFLRALPKDTPNQYYADSVAIPPDCIYKLQLQDIKAHLDTLLTKTERKIFELYYEKEESISKISTLLSMNTITVRWHRRNIQQKIHTLLYG